MTTTETMTTTKKTFDYFFTFIKSREDKFNPKKTQYIFEISEDRYTDLKKVHPWQHCERFFISLKYDSDFKFKPQPGDRIDCRPGNVQIKEYLGKFYLKFSRELFKKLFDVPSSTGKVWK